jgi:hypothetical protein
MTAILVFTTFVAFIVVDRLSNRQAAQNQLQAVFLAETGANRVRSMAVPAVASNAEEQETADRRFQFRAGHDRRRRERRGSGGQSAA